MYKPDGYLTLTNSTGIEIRLNRSNDGLIYWYNNAGKADAPSEETEIIYDQEGDPYFMTDKQVVYYLNQFMKV